MPVRSYGRAGGEVALRALQAPRMAAALTAILESVPPALGDGAAAAANGALYAARPAAARAVRVLAQSSPAACHFAFSAGAPTPHHSPFSFHAPSQPPLPACHIPCCICASHCII